MTMSATLTEIKVDDATWDGAARERRSEWKVAIDELLETHKFGVEVPSLRLLVRVPTPPGSAATTIEAFAGDVTSVATVELPPTRLSPHLDEYLDICRQMGKLGEHAYTPRLEALDIAKRLCHDEAATTLAELCRALAPDHATCRRLFTLLVALHFDTTRLSLPHHRR